MCNPASRAVVMNIWSTQLSNTPKINRLGILACDLRSVGLAVHPQRASFLLLSGPLTLGCVGWDGCFLSVFSFASELGTGIITCLYDQLPDYSPETHKMSEEQSRGLCCSAGQCYCIFCTHNIQTHKRRYKVFYILTTLQTFNAWIKSPYRHS